MTAFTFSRLWTITIDNRAGRSLASSLLKMEATGHRNFVPVFTDEDLAERFLTAINFPGLSIYPVVNMSAFADALDSLGAYDVGLDLELAGERSRAMYHGVGEFARRLRMPEVLRPEPRSGPAPGRVGKAD